MKVIEKALERAAEKTGEPLTAFELAYGALDIKGRRYGWIARFYDEEDDPSNEGHGDTPDKAVDELLKTMPVRSF